MSADLAPALLVSIKVSPSWRTTRFGPVSYVLIKAGFWDESIVTCLH